MSPYTLFSLVLLHLVKQAPCEDDSLETRRTSLAQLPLEKLLHVKQAIGTKHNFNKGDTELVEIEEEATIPLRGDWDKRRRKKPLRRGDHWDEKDGKGKGDVSSIFQTAVTALSFLAFGGYLLCLIVQAVKNNQGTGTQMVTMVPTMAPAAIVGKRRRRRAAEEVMMRTLHRIAEGYAAYALTNTSAL